MKKEEKVYKFFEERYNCIKAIDGIECAVIFEISNLLFDCTLLPTEVFIELHLSVHNIEYRNSETSWKYYITGRYCLETKESIAIALEGMIDEISTLKFDKRDCRFRTQEKIIETTSLISMFSSIDNVETNLDKCCVCHEKTGVLTSCNHHICIPCADKVHSITDEEDDDDSNVRNVLYVDREI